MKGATDDVSAGPSRESLATIRSGAEFPRCGGIQGQQRRTGVDGCSRVCDAFDVACVRASPTPSNGSRAQLIQITSSPGRPLCVRRGSRGLRNQNRREILGPRLTRLGSGAREALRLLGLRRTDEGGWWGACPKEQRSLVPFSVLKAVQDRRSVNRAATINGSRQSPRMHVPA
jgi:hypothetical protein